VSCALTALNTARMHSRRSAIAVAWLGLGLAAPVAFGQQPLLRENPQGPAEMQPATPLQPKAPEGFQLPRVEGAGALRHAPAAAGAVLRELEFRGNTVLSRDELLEAARPWLGQHVNAADLEALRLELTRRYVQRGHINSGALLDPQGLRDGRLAIEIVEGRLTGMHFSGLGRLQERYLREKLWPDAGRPLDIDDLRERYQLALDDPLIARMNARLLPDGGPGGARLDVDVERAPPWYVSLRVGNHRPASVGERAFTVEGGVRNLTGRGDLLRASAQLDDRMRSPARRGFGWSVPVNYAGTQLTLQYDDGESSIIEEPLRSVDVRSRLTAREAGVSQLLVETLRQRVAVGLDALHRTSTTSLLGQPFPFVAGVPADGLRSRSLRFWQEYTHRSETSVIALRSTFAGSTNNLEALTPPVAVADRSYRFWLGQMQLVHRFGDGGVRLGVRATVQASGARMVTLDGLSIGGASTVRGFRENQLVRDTGQIVNVELTVPILRSSAADRALDAIPFVDYGRGRSRDGAADSIGSVGVALRWREGRFTGEVAAAKRVHSTIGFARAGSALQDMGVHVQAGYTWGR
jgi:hemolysin activation/secretion protein